MAKKHKPGSRCAMPALITVHRDSQLLFALPDAVAVGTPILVHRSVGSVTNICRDIIRTRHTRQSIVKNESRDPLGNME